MQGFQPMPLMEDVDFVHRARRNYGAPAVVPLRVATSARRWQAMGLVRTSLFNMAVHTAWLLGADAQKLAVSYRRMDWMGVVGGPMTGGGGGGGGAPR